MCATWALCPRARRASIGPIQTFPVAVLARRRLTSHSPLRFTYSFEWMAHLSSCGSGGTTLWVFPAKSKSSNINQPPLLACVSIVSIVSQMFILPQYARTIRRLYRLLFFPTHAHDSPRLRLNLRSPFRPPLPRSHFFLSFDRRAKRSSIICTTSPTYGHFKIP